jgi:hypothetical protein
MPEEVYEVVTLLVCPDCVYASQYGVREMDLDPVDEERILAGLDEWPRTSFSVEYGDSPSFSYAPCDLCGDRLGGNRYHLNALRW